MASSLILTIKSEKTQAQVQSLLQIGSEKDKEGAKAVEQFVKDLRNGNHRGIIDVQTSSVAPVAASATYTLATVIATDTATVGKTIFTFTATPTTSLHVETDVGSALAFASATDLSLNTGAITESAHGYLTGDVGQLSTDGTLPTGFAASTDYHVIKIDANSYALASSQANAVAGIRIYPSALGSGNQTFTPDADKCLAFRLAEKINAHADASLLVNAVAALAVVTCTAHQKGLIGNHLVADSTGGTITVSGSGYFAGGTGGACDDVNTYTLGI